MTRRASPLLKRLDRYVGIPAVAATTPLRWMRQSQSALIVPPRRIAVVKTAAIGDTILLSAALRDLAEAYRDARLTMITGPDNAAVVPLLPVDIDEHIVVSPRSPLSAIRSTRAAGADLILDFGSWPRFDALITGLSGARRRIGFDTPGQYRRSAYDVAVPHRNDVHEVENYRALVAAAGVQSQRDPELRAPRILAEQEYPSSPYLIFHPWSGGFRGEIKEWPGERWVELAIRLGREWRYVVSGGPGDVNRSDALVVALQRAGLSATAPRFTLAEMADLCARAATVVSVNTGILHLAAAVGAPTVSLEGPVPVSRWGPVGHSARSVVSTLPRCGYLNLGFEYDGQRVDCMHGVSVDAVHASVLESIATA